MAHGSRNIQAIARLPRWNRDEAQAIVEAVHASGLSVTAFAAQHGVVAQRVFTWRRRLRREGASVGFVEVDRAVRPAARYEVAFPGGEVLRIDGPLQVAELRTLISLLREVAAC